jgi:hypothetical protein
MLAAAVPRVLGLFRVAVLHRSQSRTELSPNLGDGRGQEALDLLELLTSGEDSPAAMATRKRENALQTIGNLTILSSGLNTSQSNSAWDSKRPEMMKHSLLPINQPLFGLSDWNEDAIRSRGEDLFARALAIWPRP